MYDSVELENTVWYLMEIGEDIDLGYVKLERNILGRYKIVRLGCGGGSFRDGVAQRGRRRYYLVRRARCDRPHRQDYHDAERRDLHDGKCGGKDAFPVLHRAFSTSSAIMTSTAARCGFTTKTGTTSPRSHNLSGGGIQ